MTSLTITFVERQLGSITMRVKTPEKAQEICRKRNVTSIQSAVWKNTHTGKTVKIV